MKRLLLAICIISLLLATAILSMFTMPVSVLADTSVDEQVGAGNCDADEKANDTDFLSVSTYCSMASDTLIEWRSNSGFVFTTVAIPQGVTITTAYLELNLYSTGADDANEDIYGNDVDDANDFTAEADVTSRVRTTATVAWVENALGIGWVQSPEIKTIIQEIVDRVGWASGQDICILVDGKSDSLLGFSARSYDWNPSLAAKLHVEFVCIPTAAPDGATNEATAVTMTTARLNSYVDDDKGCPSDVEVQFEWDDDMAGAPYTHSTGWIGGYETGDFPYADIDGLADTTQHWFRAQFRNDIGTTDGNEKTFTTWNAVAAPSDFLLTAKSSTIISLQWTRGVGATNTFIQRKVGSYPVDETDGTGVYDSTLSTYEDTGLEAGVTYYYRAWGESGSVFSDNSAEMMLTTPLSDVGTGGSLTAPSTPARWFQSPNPDLVANIPGVVLLDNLAIALDIPQATVYVIFFMLITLVAGIVVYTRIRNIPVAIITVSVVMVVMSAMGILPLWMMFVFIIMGTASGYALARG